MSKICSKSNKKISRRKKKCSQTKIFTKGTKTFAVKIASNWTESCEFKVTKSELYVLTAICGLAGPSMTLSDLVCSCMAFYGIVWPCIVLYSTLTSLINVQSVITVQGGKISKKNKRRG